MFETMHAAPPEAVVIVMTGAATLVLPPLYAALIGVRSILPEGQPEAA